MRIRIKVNVYKNSANKWEKEQSSQWKGRKKIKPEINKIDIKIWSINKIRNHFFETSIKMDKFMASLRIKKVQKYMLSIRKYNEKILDTVMCKSM